MGTSRQGLIICAFCLCTLWLCLRNSITPFSRTEYQQTKRKAWTYLGPGQCKYTEPKSLDANVTIDKTLIIGFPSGDKRIVFTQMEGLTGLKTQDSWDLEYAGMTNDPFVKGNYPHQEGIWGWEDSADQVILAVRNIKLAMIEYHAERSKLRYSNNYWETQMYRDKPYLQQATRLSDFKKWCAIKVMGEIKRYGWFIDYWMEGGLLRDSSSNGITTQTHWEMLREPLAWTSKQVTDQYEADTLAGITATYDTNCMNITKGCEPVAVIDADAVVNTVLGAHESRKIAQFLNNTPGVRDYLINEDAWECIWTELIENHQAPGHTRLEYIEDNYDLPSFIFMAMNAELMRLIRKYRAADWAGNEVAARLVDILNIHRAEIVSDYLEKKSAEEAAAEAAGDNLSG